MPKTKKPPSPDEEHSESGGGKATAAQVERRVNEVYKLILRGLSRSDICQYVSDFDDKCAKSDKPEERAKAWNVDERTIDRYIQRATERFKEYAASQREEMFSKSVARFEVVYSSCIRVQDYSKAIAALRELHLLMGLHEPQKIIDQHQGAIEIIVRRNHAKSDENDSD